MKPGFFSFFLPLFFCPGFSGGSEADSAERQALVLMSVFGLTDRFVASMKGVALTVDPQLQLHDLTHEIEPFNVWQASYVLAGTIDYWPRGTVFVSVVDPGVGTARKSVVLQTKSGHYIVTPDNGSLTFIAEKQGIAAVREIDESTNRLPGSDSFHTFHGRDVYVYTGARLAAGAIRYAQVGPLLEPEVVTLPYQRPEKRGDATVVGAVIHVEQPFGNVVTNIPRSLLGELGVAPNGNTRVAVELLRSGAGVFSEELPYVPSFGFVDTGAPLLYVDSLGAVGLAVNSGNFADEYAVRAGSEWQIAIRRLD